jgi:hypothetical protein
MSADNEVSICPGPKLLQGYPKAVYLYGLGGHTEVLLFFVSILMYLFICIYFIFPFFFLSFFHTWYPISPRCVLALLHSYLSVSVYGSTALCWALAAFQFLDPIHSRQDSLDGGSARRKASNYIQNTNTE